MDKLGMFRLIALILAGMILSFSSFSQKSPDGMLIQKIDEQVLQQMEEGNIPGVSLVILRGRQRVIRTYGYSNLVEKKPVMATTLFELGSCSKAFTALAVARLVQQNKVQLNSPLTDYLPWLRLTYKGRPASVTVRQLLHHTSGIPWNTLSKIPQANGDDALENTVRVLVGQELKQRPGKKYEYATINYDVLALIVQTVTGHSFENYLQANIMQPLRLGNTTIGRPADSAWLSEGYKIGFFKPRVYRAPVFKGNNAAGYVVSNAIDMARWLQFQLGMISSPLYEMAKFTHRRDDTVPLHGMMSYAMGWEVSLSGNGEISHGGLNPNYSAYVAFRPRQRLGVAVLANSNSTFTPSIADKTMRLLAKEEAEREYDPGDRNDAAFSCASLLTGGYVLAVLASLMMVAIDIDLGRRKYVPLTRTKLGKLVLSSVMMLPFLYGIYILPEAVFGFSWESIIIWTPMSLLWTLLLVVSAIAISYLAYLISVIFPGRNSLRTVTSRMLVISVLSSLANMLIIVLVTSSLESDTEIKYQVFYYCLTLSVYLVGRRYVQVHLIRLSRRLTYELRSKLIEKIFSTSYGKFEPIAPGRVYTAVNDDVDAIGNATNTLVVLVTSVLTAVGAFLYLATIAVWATLMTFVIITVLMTLYFYVINRTNRYYEEARDTRNAFMDLINNMIRGFKELSLHRNKKLAYQEDVATSANEYRQKITIAGIRFVDASLVGESVLILLLGMVVFAFPKLFPDIKTYSLMTFVVVLLYLIGPVSTVLNSIPTIMGLKVAWDRVQLFLQELPANLNLYDIVPVSVPTTVEVFTVKGVQFSYPRGGEQNLFTVGPIELEVRKGEVVFIIGGNGSGKTTLAKLLTGLYEPEAGTFKINGRVIQSPELGEYYSTVFSPAHLFEKLYNINADDNPSEVAGYLKLLDLDKKVEIKDNKYSTIALSSGQIKRLALLQCYLEDSPIYLFDEWAADQDPAYRSFFYRDLLPRMRERGKIVIAVTHDDHYFDAADRVYRMTEGKLEEYSSELGIATEDEPMKQR